MRELKNREPSMLTIAGENFMTTGSQTEELETLTLPLTPWSDQ